jgi:hypothetical protein
MANHDRTASLMTPSKLAQIRPASAASPAAWLSQMAADAGHRHVRRLGELRGELQEQALLRDLSPLSSELARVAQALPRLDFGLLQNRGWWARTTGKSRGAGEEFAAQFNVIDLVAHGLAGQTQALQKAQQEQAAAADLTLLELEVEYRAIDKIIEQGTRWLHDMRGQLKTRQAAPADPADREPIDGDDDEARCKILVARLKALRAVSSAAQQSHRHGQDASVRRAALLHFLQQAIASGVNGWRARVSSLAAAAADGRSPELSVDGPMEAHRELQLCLKQVVADCGQLQAQEKVLADSLTALGTQVEGA